MSIKFRLWDTINKTWLDPSNYTLGHDGTVYKKGTLNVIEDVSIHFSTLFTDINGSELYEDDIVSVKIPMGGFLRSSTRTRFGVIKYSKELGGFNIKWIKGGKIHYITLDDDITGRAILLGNRMEDKLSSFHIETGIFD